MNKHIHIRGEEDSDPTTNGSGNDDNSVSTEDEIIPPEMESTTPVEDDAADAAKRLKEAEDAAQANYDRLLRVSAEFDNYKKRSAREMQDVIKYATEKLASELLTVVDNLERAVESAATRCECDDPLLQGVSLVLGDIQKILDRHHVKPIKAIGEPFDPALHQAMMQEPSGEYPPNTVVREMQKGYLIHDRLLRPTLVAVSTAADNQQFEKNIKS